MENLLRLIVDPPAAGTWNMALDEALLESVAAEQVPTLRFYRWREPTLSLGYFQPLAQRKQHEASRRCAIVRRSSGGGAIVHDVELTYCLTLPASHRRARDSAALYEAVHQGLLASLAEFGISASLWTTGVANGPTKPFLCFERRALRDVLVRQIKVAGSAQRRSGRAMMQHGSLLLARSAARPELPGIAELTGARLPVDRLVASWSQQVAVRLSARLQSGQVTPLEQRRARAATQAKYGCRAWTERR